MFPKNDDEIVYDFFAKALNINIVQRPENEQQQKNAWDSSATLSLLILVISNTVLLGFFVWIFSI
jgi:hypothetical protein